MTYIIHYNWMGAGSLSQKLMSNLKTGPNHMAYLVAAQSLDIKIIFWLPECLLKQVRHELHPSIEIKTIESLLNNPIDGIQNEAAVRQDIKVCVAKLNQHQAFSAAKDLMSLVILMAYGGLYLDTTTIPYTAPDFTQAPHVVTLPNITSTFMHKTLTIYDSYPENNTSIEAIHEKAIDLIIDTWAIYAPNINEPIIQRMIMVYIQSMKKDFNSAFSDSYPIITDDGDKLMMSDMRDIVISRRIIYALLNGFIDSQAPRIIINDTNFANHLFSVVMSGINSHLINSPFLQNLTKYYTGSWRSTSLRKTQPRTRNFYDLNLTVDDYAILMRSNGIKIFLEFSLGNGIYPFKSFIVPVLESLTASEQNKILASLTDTETLDLLLNLPECIDRLNLFNMLSKPDAIAIFSQMKLEDKWNLLSAMTTPIPDELLYFYTYQLNAIKNYICYDLHRIVIQGFMDNNMLFAILNMSLNDQFILLNTLPLEAKYKFFSTMNNDLLTYFFSSIESKDYELIFLRFVSQASSRYALSNFCNSIPILERTILLSQLTLDQKVYLVEGSIDIFFILRDTDCVSVFAKLNCTLQVTILQNLRKNNAMNLITKILEQLSIKEKVAIVYYNNELIWLLPNNEYVLVFINCAFDKNLILLAMMSDSVFNLLLTTLSMQEKIKLLPFCIKYASSYDLFNKPTLIHRMAILLDSIPSNSNQLLNMNNTRKLKHSLTHKIFDRYDDLYECLTDLLYYAIKNAKNLNDLIYWMHGVMRCLDGCQQDTFEILYPYKFNNKLMDELIVYQDNNLVTFTV